MHHGSVSPPKYSKVKEMLLRNMLQELMILMTGGYSDLLRINVQQGKGKTRTLGRSRSLTTLTTMQQQYGAQSRGGLGGDVQEHQHSSSGMVGW